MTYENFERKTDAKLILSIVAAGIMSFTGVVVETAMNTTFPTLMREFSVSTSTVQWITTGYLLVLAIVIPSSAYLKTRFLTKQLFLTAIILFMAGTLLCAFAPFFFLLLLGRLVQGIGTGIALPLMFNIVQEQAPLDKMGFLMGIASLITAIAPAVGPFFGGLIIELLGWRMIFIILFPLLVLSLIFGVYAIRQASETKKAHYDLSGNLLLAVCFTALILGVNSAGTKGWLSLQVLILILCAVLFASFYVLHARKAARPLISLDIFSTSGFVFSLCAMIILQFITLGIGFLIPNFAQIAWGKNAFVAGCILLPGCALGAALAPVSGRILDSLGAAKPLRFGAFCIMISSALFMMPLSKSSVLILTLIYMIYTLGQGFTSGNTLTNGLAALPAELNKDGNAAFNTMQQLGGAVGTAVASSVVAVYQGDTAVPLSVSTLSGTHAAFILLFVTSIMFVVFEFSATSMKKAS